MFHLGPGAALKNTHTLFMQAQGRIAPERLDISRIDTSINLLPSTRFDLGGRRRDAVLNDVVHPARRPAERVGLARPGRLCST
jgi:hypothetical protein